MAGVNTNMTTFNIKTTEMADIFRTIGKKGGKATLKKYGKQHFKKLAEKRWKKKK